MVRTRDGGTHLIHRGLLGATVSAIGVDVRVGVTHLDHMKSVERQTQMRHALRALLAPEPASVLLLGDLNALSRADYTTDQWSAHEAFNAANGWDAPADEAAAGGVLDLLRQERFVDAYAALDAPGRWRDAPWSAHVATERPPYRLDYVWSRAPASAGGRRLVPLGAFVADGGEASDHQPVVVDFEAVAYDAGE